MNKHLLATHPLYARSLRWMGLLLYCLLLVTTVQATSFTVTTTADSGPGSLRQAILSANADASASANNPHLITITVTGTITLASPFLVITNHVTLQGPGQANLTISGNNTTRIFWLQNGTITIRDLTLANGLAKGGDGAGGGLGAGGAIFMHEGRQGGSGSLAVQLINVTLTGNKAQGGNYKDSEGGGGGGMGGSGGLYGGGGGVLGNGVDSGGTNGGGGSVTDGSGAAGGTNGGIAIFGSGGNAGNPPAPGEFGGGGGKATNKQRAAGGAGGFGGGGGMGADDDTGKAGKGGNGGFGGGGGTGGTGNYFPGKPENGGDGGDGGYGAGAGRAQALGLQGKWGFGAGIGASGGGMGAGGAIFVTSGYLSLTNVSLTNNSATGGIGKVSNNGKGFGGAIFIFNKEDVSRVAAPGTTHDPSVSACGLTFSGNTASSQAVNADNNQYGSFRDNKVTLIQQPVSGSSVCAGTTVTASVSASGTVSGYQWYQDGILLANQSAATLTLPNTTTANSGSYVAVVTGCNSVTSTPFNLTMTPQSPDYQPLVDFYNATNGPGWTNKTNWLTGCTPCGWYGVTCDGNGRVISLSLNGNQLSGSIPASLSALTNLGLLNLSQNQFSGSIPAGLSALKKLQNLVLNNNQLSGSIPASLSALTNLNGFYLNNNQFSGSIPAGLSALINLGQLDFSNNQLSGCFPASLSSQCYQAQNLNFSNNPGLPGGGNFVAIVNFCRNGVGSDAFRPLATASPDPVCVGNPVSLNVTAGTAYQWSGPAGFSSTAQSPTLTATTSGLYSVTVGNGSPTCTASASVSVTVNALPSPTIPGLASAYCQDAGPQSLSGSPAGGVFTVDSSPGTSFNPASLSVGQHTVGYSYTNSSGCAATTSANVTVNAPPSAPTLVTQSGYAYPAGGSSLTIAQNVGPVSLTVAGCSGGMLMANGNAASSFTVSTAMTGTQTYTATCSLGGCTSPAGSFQLTVLPTTLSVLHKDVDYGQTQDQIIKPFLKLANTGGQPVPYGELTVRYWFTAEGNSPPTDFQLYYAQLGAVTMKYVPLAQPRQGAFGYVEYSFPGGGSLPANGNSGPIENGILKKDRSNFNETDDYSYQPNRDYLPNARITAYRNGADGVPVIVWGQEPTPVASQTAVQVYSAAKDGGITSQIQTRLELRNTGNVALAVSALKLRYYFTSDNGQTANVYVDYADLGASNVQARVVRLAAPVNGADSYVELSFPGNPRQLGPLSSLGVIDFRLVRSDFGLFSQGNDYSYAPIYGPVGLNNRVTVLLNNTLLFGTPPSGAPARVGASEPMLALQVTVLGNPVVGDQAQIEIRGAEGQVVNVRLVDLQGRTIHEQRIEQAGETELVNVPLGQSRGLLLLKVSTASQQQRLKLVRP